MRDSRRSIIFSLPLFCSISRPEIETATAACAIGYCATVNTSDGAMLRTS
jgi:hypothetical protein